MWVNVRRAKLIEIINEFSIGLALLVEIIIFSPLENGVIIEPILIHIVIPKR